jgi:hypothetical protein
MSLNIMAKLSPTEHSSMAAGSRQKRPYPIMEHDTINGSFHRNVAQSLDFDFVSIHRKM